MVVKTLEKILSFITTVIIIGGGFRLADKGLDLTNKSDAHQYIIGTVSEYDIDDEKIRRYIDYAIENANRLYDDPDAVLVDEPDVDDNYRDGVIDGWKAAINTVTEFFEKAGCYRHDERVD